MKVYFPSYYNKFKCIAERCQNSCCVGWEITVDQKTLQKYEQSGREDILRHISCGSIELCDGGRCPFLTERGLCQIISKLGEEYTSVICREHPRFYHRIGERVEGGIGASCEEAARIILSSDGYDSFVSVEKDSVDAPDETELDTKAEREEIYAILSDRALPFSARVSKIRDRYAIPKNIHTTDEWQEIFSSLEMLDESHRVLFEVGGSCENSAAVLYLERFLAYLIFRHASVAENYDNLRARVAFCLLLTEVLENFISEAAPDEAKIIDAARIISEEIEYSEDNTSALIFEMECVL